MAQQNDNKDATKRQKTEIEQLTRNCEEVHKTIEDALKEVDSVSVQFERNAVKAEEKIDKAFNRALSMLEDNKNMLMGEIKTIVSERKKQIDAKKDEIQHQETRLVTTLQMATEVVQTGSEYDLAPVYPSLKTNLDALRDIKPVCTKKHLEDMSFKPAQASHQAYQYLGYISSRCRRVKEGVWRLQREFGKDGAGKLGCGRDVSMTQQGDIAIADHSMMDPSIQIYNTNGDFKFKIQLQDSDRPWNVAVSPDESAFVAGIMKHISVYDFEGILKRQFPARSPDNISSDSQNTRLWSLAIDNQKNLLVGEVNQNYISKHRLDGTHIMSFYTTISPYYKAVSPQDKIIVSCCA